MGVSVSSKCSSHWSERREEESLGTEHGQPAGNREREREMATLAAGRGSQQSAVSRYRAGGGTEKLHWDCLAGNTTSATEHHQPTPTRGKIGVSTQQKNANKLCMFF